MSKRDHNFSVNEIIRPDCFGYGGTTSSWELDQSWIGECGQRISITDHFETRAELDCWMEHVADLTGANDLGLFKTHRPYQA